MAQGLGYLVDLRTVELADSGPTWIQALPLGTYQHPVHGKIEVTPERVQRFAANVKNNVRETELDIDYDHKIQRTDAAGWVKDAEARPTGLWIAVEWTKEALQKLKDKAYRYFSPEFSDDWEHPKTKQTYKDVLFGGGLTNRPFLKDILPINLSEIIENNNGGNVVDPKKVRKLLGLPDDATDEQVQAKIDEGITKLEQPEPVVEPKVEVEPKPDEVMASELKKLAETSPALATALNAVLEQNKTLTETVGKLETANQLSNVNLKLNELSKGKQFAVAPAVQDKIRDAALAPTADKFFAVLGELVNGGLVELGERNGANPTHESNAVKSFTEKVDAAIKANDKLSYVDAVEAVASENPDLFRQYRDETYIQEGAK